MACILGHIIRTDQLLQLSRPYRHRPMCPNAKCGLFWGTAVKQHTTEYMGNTIKASFRSFAHLL